MKLANRLGKVSIAVLLIPIYMQNTVQMPVLRSCTAWEENFPFSPSPNTIFRKTPCIANSSR